jgi:uncharacterized membrane protein YfcA
MTTTLLAIAGTSLLIGIAIGATGIGGVLLVPFLTLTLGIEVKRAIAAVLLSYLPSCIMAVILYGRRGSLPWREAKLICLAALPTVWAGARVAQFAPSTLLEAAIGVLLLAGGSYALLPPRAAGHRTLSAPMLLALGAGTGFLAAITGAGGAFVLLPILLLLDMPVLPAIGLGMAIALPVAVVASAANLTAGTLDVWLAVVIGSALTVGIAIGTPIAHALPQLKLRRLLGSTVVLAGLAMLARTAARLATN